MSRPFGSIVLALTLVLGVQMAIAEEWWVEAEDFDSLTGPITVQDDPEASGGRFIHTDESVGNSSNNPPDDGATYNINLQGGTYKIYGRVIAPEESGSADSFWVRIEGATTNTNNHSSGWVRWNNFTRSSTWV